MFPLRICGTKLRTIAGYNRDERSDSLYDEKTLSRARSFMSSLYRPLNFLVSVLNEGRNLHD
jgi:hypothetical protein